MKKPRIHSIRRGAALVVSVLMALLLIAIAGATLSLVSTNRRVTDAHFTQHALLPAAERGLDQAMKVVNTYLKINKTATTGKLATEDCTGSWETGTSGTGDGWRQFTPDASFPKPQDNTYSYYKDFGSIKLGDGRTCGLKVKVLNIPTTKTELPYNTYAVAEVTGPSYTRQFLAAFAANSGQAPGMVSMQLISFSGGNVFIAAYDSRHGAPNATYTDPVDGKSKKNISSDVTVATFYAKDLSLDQVNIYGFVSTIPGTEAEFVKNAHIWDVNSDTPYQTKGVDGYDSARVLYDPVENPAPAGLNPTTNIKDDFTLNPDDFTVKGDSDILAAVKTNFPAFTGSTLPAKTASNTITADNSGNISINGTKVTSLNASSVSGGVFYMDSAIDMKSTSPSLNIVGNVTVINKTPDNAFTVSGQGNLLIQNTDSSLSIYTHGDVTAGGNAIMGATSTTNLVSPRQFLVSGTNPTPAQQTIKFAGNGAFIGIIYAPNATYEMKGGGKPGETGMVQGSVVAYTVYANGVTSFYYDKNLASTTAIQYRLSSITELTGKNKVSM
jgi:Tfp pilus assembly protein PilX